MQELSETPALDKVLGFRSPDEGDRVFVVEKITSSTNTTILVRLLDEEDEAVGLRGYYTSPIALIAHCVQTPNCRKIETESQWEGLLAEVFRMFPCWI